VWPITFQLPPDVAVFSELNQAASGKGWARVPLPPSLLSKLTGFGAEVSYTVTVDTDRSKERQVILSPASPDLMPLQVRDTPSHSPSESAFTPSARPLPLHAHPRLVAFRTRADQRLVLHALRRQRPVPRRGSRDGRFGKCFPPWWRELLIPWLQIGIQHPAAFGPGDSITFKLMISSSKPEFADVLTGPYAVRAELMRSVIMGDGALNASYGNHDRSLHPLFGGHIWREGSDSLGGGGRDRDSTSTPSLEEDVDFSSRVIRDVPQPRANQLQVRQRASVPVLREGERRNSKDSLSTSAESEGEKVGLGSGKVVRMEGRIQLPTGRMMKPSFRFNAVAIEYLIVVTFTPPDYTHISPHGIFQAECPVWLCSDWQSYQPPRVAPRRPGAGAGSGSGGGVMRGETVDLNQGRVVREGEVRGATPVRERRSRY